MCAAKSMIACAVYVHRYTNTCLDDPDAAVGAIQVQVPKVHQVVLGHHGGRRPNAALARRMHGLVVWWGVRGVRWLACVVAPSNRSNRSMGRSSRWIDKAGSPMDGLTALRATAVLPAALGTKARAPWTRSRRAAPSSRSRGSSGVVVGERGMGDRSKG